MSHTVQEVTSDRPRVWPKRLVQASLAVLVMAFVVTAGFYWRSTKIQSLASECKAAVRAEDWKRLRLVASQYQSWEPTKAAPIIFLAEAANQQGRLAEAAAILERLPESDPMTPPALVERSTLLFGPLNRPLEAAETLERALKLNPRLVEARRRLIYFYAFTLQRRKMVAHAYAAMQHDSDLPETYVYLISQDWLSFANAFEENTRWLASNPDEELFLVARAIYRVTSKALDEASEPNQVEVLDEQGLPYHRRVLAEYFQRFPHNTELLAYYLKEATTNGDAAEVARLLARVPPDAVDDNRFWRFKGWLHNVKGEPFQAEECYRKALVLNPYDYVSQHQLAGVQRRLNRPDQVDTLEALACEGQLIRREILQLPDVTKVPPELMMRMATHAAACGDSVTANKLFFRIEQNK